MTEYELQQLLLRTRIDVGPSPATRLADRGLATRMADARAAHRGNNPRAGIAAYCAGNKWLTENARAVGNL